MSDGTFVYGVSTVRQCPMLAQYDGANCCALEDGHDGPHRNSFGSERGPWGTPEEFFAIERDWYVIPKSLRTCDEIHRALAVQAAKRGSTTHTTCCVCELPIAVPCEPQQANDEPDEVVVEMRAAHFADVVGESIEDHTRRVIWTAALLAGWRGWNDDEFEPASDDQLVGWLAREIFKHEDQR